MNYTNWVKLFGKSAADKQVRDALAKAGIKTRIKIEKDWLSESKDIKGQGTTIIFTSETILYPKAKGTEANPILSGVLMVLYDKKNKNDVYKGSLPHGLKKGESQKALRGRLGKPAQINKKYRSEAWLIDGLELAVTYSEDLQSLTQVSVTLPNSQ